jgi:hypothetical protein
MTRAATIRASTSTLRVSRHPYMSQCSQNIEEWGLSNLCGPLQHLLHASKQPCQPTSTVGKLDKRPGSTLRSPTAIPGRSRNGKLYRGDLRRRFLSMEQHERTIFHSKKHQTNHLRLCWSLSPYEKGFEIKKDDPQARPSRKGLYNSVSQSLLSLFTYRIQLVKRLATYQPCLL